MYKDIYLPSLMRERNITNDRYTKVSEQKATEIALAVQHMYHSNGIPIEVTQKVITKKSPAVSVTLHSTGITLRLGVFGKKTSITKVTPKRRD